MVNILGCSLNLGEKWADVGETH